MRRVILHLDMDAFYASVEILDNPTLRGKPVIVGGTPEGHGVVSTASYEARRFGIHSAMPASRAIRLCPDGIFLPPRPQRYAELSRKVMSVLEEYTPLVERISIDEAFLDVTGSLRLAGPPLAIAHALQNRIGEVTGGLTASVGIASNKFLAKVASDLRKPEGLVVVPGDGALDFLAPLGVNRIWGVGPKTAEQLHSAGYHTIGDLQSGSEKSLRSSFGNDLGSHLHRLANGLDDRPVIPSSKPRSVSSETTLAQFIPAQDLEAVERLLLSLSDDVSWRLRRSGARGRTVSLKVRDERFVTRTRSSSSEVPVHLTEEIYAVARHLFATKIDLNGLKIRLLGVGVSQLAFSDHHQVDLFESESKAKSLRVAEAVDSIRDRLGHRSIGIGRLVKPPPP